MMNTFLRNPSLPALLTISEIQALIEHLPYAALMVNVSEGLILCANQKAATLAGCTASEFHSQPLATFLPEINEKNILSNDSIALTFKQLDGRMLPITAKQSLLPPLGMWALVRIEDDAKSNKQAEQQSLLLNALQEVGKTSQDSSFDANVQHLDTSIQQLLRIASLIADSELTAIYQVKGEKNLQHLTQVNGTAGMLPKYLAKQDVIRLKVPLLWTTQERAPTLLHRMVRNTYYTYVASAPIGNEKNQIGTIVMAGKKTPSPLVFPVTQVLAHFLTNSLQAYHKIQHDKELIKQQQQQINQHKLIQNSLQDGIILVSATKKIENMNDYAEQMLGYANVEVGGQPIENVLIGNENLPHALNVADSIGYTHEIGAMTLYRRDGKSFLANIRISPIPNGKKSGGWAILLQDLSQEEQYRLRIQQLEQRALLGEVTAIFAHEVRNPINNISTSLQLMSMNLAPEACEQEQINRMKQDCDRLSELMKSVLAFARPQEYKLEKLAIEQFLSRLLERWHPRLARAKINYELHIEAEIGPIRADPRALEQVLTNLIHNAMQAMKPDGGKLTVRIRQKLPASGGCYVEISLADTGPGIPEELRERIFEPFFTTKSGGTGLGLAITKQIITAHRGTIHVTSIPGGTAFQVLLPVYRGTDNDEDTENSL